MANSFAIGRWLKQDDLEGRRRSITVGPGNAAIVIRNGDYGEPHIGEKVYTKGVIPNPFSTHDIEVLNVDLSPFTIDFELNNLQPNPMDPSATRFKLPLLTKDDKLVIGHVGLTLQVDRERPHLLFRLRQDRSAIGPDHIADAIRDMFVAAVIATNLIEIDSADLRGTKEHFAALYADARLQLEEFLRAYGLQVVGFAPSLLPSDAVPEPGVVLPPVPPPPPPPPPLPHSRKLPVGAVLRGITYAAVLAAVLVYFFVPIVWPWEGENGQVEVIPVAPSNAVIVDHWATGHFFFEGGFQEMAAAFNEEKHKTASGRQIWVRMSNNPSSIQARDLLSRVKDGIPQSYICCPPGGPDPHPDPTIVTPSSVHWLFDTNFQLNKVGLPDVVDTASAESIALTYIGIVTYREMAECLGWPETPIGFEEIIALRDNPLGWGADKYSHCAKSEWGTKPLVAFTDPAESSTGRSVLLALYPIAAEKAPEDLELSDVTSKKVVDYVTYFQTLIDHYMIGTSMLLTKLSQGPRFGHFLLMPEDNLIQMKEGTARIFVNGVQQTIDPITRPMVMIYPKEGGLTRSNCACIVTADWVTDLQKEAAQQWIDYLREEPQQRELMRHGFRNVIDLVLGPDDPDNKHKPENGLMPGTPDPILEVSKIKPEVAALIDEQWPDVKRHGILTFVVDTSGSMNGDKMEQARDGLIGAFDLMADKNEVGLISFGSDVVMEVPIAPLTENRGKLGDAVFDMKAAGQTALYDAIAAGVEMTDAVESEGNPIRAVVVVTDGKSNRGGLRLHDIINMSTTDEEEVVNFLGTEGGPPPRVMGRDGVVRIVSPEDALGDSMKLETENEIQIFFIGIGKDTDLNIGGLLAGATDAEFQGVTEDDLAELLAEFSGYF